MFRVLGFLAKKEGIETRAFIDYYENNHVPLICRLAGAPIVLQTEIRLCGTRN